MVETDVTGVAVSKLGILASKKDKIAEGKCRTTHLSL